MYFVSRINVFSDKNSSETKNPFPGVFYHVITRGDGGTYFKTVIR